ncbi:MAG: hypothetical protein ABI882_12680 [Acidobacteriota bacterium]
MRTFLLITLLVSPAFAQTTGTWRMNPDKSTGNDEAPLPRSLLIRCEPHPDGEAATIWRITEDGRSETVSMILRYDGRDHPHLLEEGFDAVSARKRENGDIEVAYKRDGKVVSRQIRRLTPDGQQMTIHLQFLSKTGTWLKGVMVFEKQRE